MVMARSKKTTGLIFGFSAYLIWGSFPLIIVAANFADPLEIVTWRVIFGFLFAALLVTITRKWREIILIMRSPKKLGWIAVAALFIFINWEVYVIAVATGNTIESSLGYFINPLITILFAVLLLKERLRTTQWAALGIGFVAVVILTFDYGRPPWIAFILAISFATYSLAKNKVGGKIGALQSFTIESAVLVPVAVLQFLLVANTLEIQITKGPLEASVLIGFGILTAIPLILFGSAASRIPLSMIGFIQYLTPVLQFSTAYFILGEEMPPVRWIGFSLVWLSLVVLTSDALLRKRPAIPLVPNS
ncbi:chloramphenicol-sensitive protein RarD [Candidatus Aquiluna sp. UB-MaderosW2red]|nr:chloramphenicol-sensitive protein RarD [Candidatus Aquiluna sp. UB-MaderosW2red]